jgi:hypothetical protein
LLAIVGRVIILAQATVLIVIRTGSYVEE